MAKVVSPLNPYQIEAAEKLLATFTDLPLAKKLTYDCTGIVGGDFRVTITREYSEPHREHIPFVEVTTL